MTKWLTSTKELSRPGPGRVPAAVARDLLRLIGAFEGDARHFLKAAGLARLAGYLDQDASPDTMPHHDFSQLYQHAVAILDVHAARQEGRESLTKAGVDMMCHAIITCRTLREVIARMATYSDLLAPRTGRLALVVADGIATLQMATIRQVRNGCSYLSDLTGLASYHRLLGWLSGEDIPLIGAMMRYPPLLDPQTVAYLMPGPVRHRAPENGLSFAARHLDRPVVRSHHELAQLLERFPFDIEAPQSKRTPLSERISHLVSAILASGEALPTARDLAGQFSISTATLKRRLAAEGTALSQIKAAARREVAERLLADPRLSIAEIARRTRFSDVGAFRRAFAAWTGQSPSAWRRASAA